MIFNIEYEFVVLIIRVLNVSVNEYDVLGQICLKVINVCL